MPVILWMVLALVVGLAGVALAARLALAKVPRLELPEGESLAATPLQRLARHSLVLGLVPLVAAVGLFAWAGLDRYFENDTVRVTGTLLLLATIVVLAAFSIRANALALRGRSPLDERDREILRRAPAVEGGPMIIALACWVIGLHETFNATRLVPVEYLGLVFWSLLVVKAYALPIGVLLQYRRN